MKSGLIRIQSVQKSARGNTYATDIKGQWYMPKTQDMELNAGDYAYFVENLQTKAYAEDGETLVDLAEPRSVLQITATFATKADAIGAAAEAGTLEMEVVAEVRKSAKELGLSDEAVKALAAAF